MASTENQAVKHYFNIAQYRTDKWYQLKELTDKLERGSMPRNSGATKKMMTSAFNSLRILEQYWAYPGTERLEALAKRFANKEFGALASETRLFVRNLVSDSYREARRDDEAPETLTNLPIEDEKDDFRGKQNYFELLIADSLGPEEARIIKKQLKKVVRNEDPFVYETITAHTFQDTITAVLFNPNIQACVIRYGLPYRSKNDLSELRPFLSKISEYSEQLQQASENQLGLLLGEVLKDLRPELDLYYVTDTPVGDIDDLAVGGFKRIFYRKEALQELHLTVLRGIKERYETPFFSALMEYSQKPTGVFHAMPISRGNSVFKSRWIQDFGKFYGRNLFLAETSATTGGLDSLLQPTGTLKLAQEKASRAYGSRKTFFVTNGTSTANKIVQQALIRPDDVVLIDRDCHKSHHYGLVQSGAYPVYLDSYPVQEYSMYGAVPLKEIKKKLLQLKDAGRLDKVKMLLLTNCTFDGLVYNVERVMETVLAIKPDMVFLWDEAWFAFAGFTHTYKQRTGMYVAQKLYKKYQSREYRETYKRMLANLKAGEIPTIPDPDLVKIRVYSTQSTHKTLTSMRQGSMIHIWDELFQRKAEDAFHEAYMTHTSTSPNYQILASLDAGRRQVEFEGFEMVEKSVEMAMALRSKVVTHPLLSRFFDVLTVKNFIPEAYRESGIEEYFNAETGWTRMEEAFAHDEFVLDPTKVNLFIGKTGVDGDTFKNKYLMDQFGIQINKTSRNTVLFMTNIGTTRGSLAYLVGVLIKIATQLDEQFKSLNKEELKINRRKIKSLTQNAPELPDFSHFHSSFQAVPGVPGGNLREAFFLSYDEDKCEYIKLKPALKAIQAGREIVSASFVIPYPPGFPVLVPGQVISEAILNFLIKLDVKEVHGYRPELGLRVFCESVLHRKKHATAMMGAGKASNGQSIHQKININKSSKHE